MTEAEDVRRIHSEQSVWIAIKRELKTFAGTFCLLGAWAAGCLLLWMWRAGWL